MSWQFELVAGPYQGPTGGVLWDNGEVLFSAIDEGRLLRLAHDSKKVTEFRRYANRVNGLGHGPSGEIYGAQEGGRRLVEFTPDGRLVAVDALLDGKYHNQPSDLVVDRRHRIYFTDPRHPVIPFGPAIFPFLEHCSVLRLKRNDRRAWVATRVTFDTVSLLLQRRASPADFPDREFLQVRIRLQDSIVAELACPLAQALHCERLKLIAVRAPVPDACQLVRKLPAR